MADARIVKGLLTWIASLPIYKNFIGLITAVETTQLDFTFSFNVKFSKSCWLVFVLEVFHGRVRNVFVFLHFNWRDKVVNQVVVEAVKGSKVVVPSEVPVKVLSRFKVDLCSKFKP